MAVELNKLSTYIKGRVQSLSLEGGAGSFAADQLGQDVTGFSPADGFVGSNASAFTLQTAVTVDAPKGSAPVTATFEPILTSFESPTVDLGWGTAINRNPAYLFVEPDRDEKRIDSGSGSLSLPRTTAFTTERTWINKLQDVPSNKMSPLGDLLTLGLTEPSGTLVSRRDDLHRQAVRHKNFRQALSAAVSEQRTDAQGVVHRSTRSDALVRLRSLETFLLTGEVPSNWRQNGTKNSIPSEELFRKKAPSELLPDEMGALMESYRDLGSFEDVARFYENCREKFPHLAHYDVPREQYIVALNRLGSSRILDSIQESESLLDSTVAAQRCSLGPQLPNSNFQRKLYRNLGLNGDILSGLGKAYRNIGELAEMEIDAKARKSHFGQLLSDLTGVKFQDFKVGVGDSTAGEIGLQRATSKFTRRIATLTGRDFKPGTPEYADNIKDLASYLERCVGLPMSKWTTQVAPGQLAWQLRGANNPLEKIEKLSGCPVRAWHLTQKETYGAANSSLNKVAAQVACGSSFERLVEAAEQLTGAKLSEVPRAVLAARAAQLQQSVTTQGQLDSKLVECISRQTGCCDAKNLLDISRQAKEVSRDYYLAGFGVDFDSFPGSNLIYAELALGNYQRAQDLIPLVQRAVVRDGGAKTTDYWNLAAQTELALLGDQHENVYQLLPRVLGNAKVAWELETTAAGLERLSAQRAELGVDHKMMDFVAKKIRQRVAAGFPPAPGFQLERFLVDAQIEMSPMMPSGLIYGPMSPKHEQRRAVTEKIFQKSKNFNEAFRSRFVGGSWAHTNKGGVSDTVINRPTIAALRHINSYLGFDELTSPEDFPQFAAGMHRYIDAKFGLVEANGQRGMEHLDSDTHKKRDRFTENRHELCQSRVSGNANTNLLVEIALGQSDCRHTAATFQACADLWKRDRQTHELQESLDAIVAGDKGAAKAAFQRALAWDKIQVVTMDMAFKAAVQPVQDAEGRPKKYALKTDESGHFVRTVDGELTKDPKSGKPFTLEDHTMPVLLQMDDTGQYVEKMRAVDPFYRNLWNLGDVEIDPKGILDEDKGLYLGNRGLPASDGKPIELYAVPCRYSGRPLEKTLGECGQVTFGGMEVALPDLDSLLSLSPKLKRFTDAVSDLRS